MGGGFPVSDGARDNNHRREITMLIFVAPQGVVWQGYPSLEGPHITKRPRAIGWSSMIRRAAPRPHPS